MLLPDCLDLYRLAVAAMIMYNSPESVQFKLDRPGHAHDRRDAGPGLPLHFSGGGRQEDRRAVINEVQLGIANDAARPVRKHLELLGAVYIRSSRPTASRGSASSRRHTPRRGVGPIAYITPPPGLFCFLKGSRAQLTR